METAYTYEAWDCPKCHTMNFSSSDEEEGVCAECGVEFELKR